jgi:hypothetical protein
MSDLFTPAGRKAIDDARLDAPFHARALSLRLIDAVGVAAGSAGWYGAVCRFLC